MRNDEVTERVEWRETLQSMQNYCPQNNVPCPTPGTCRMCGCQLSNPQPLMSLLQRNQVEDDGEDGVVVRGYN